MVPTDTTVWPNDVVFDPQIHGSLRIVSFVSSFLPSSHVLTLIKSMLRLSSPVNHVCRQRGSKSNVGARTLSMCRRQYMMTSGITSLLPTCSLSM